ncbi:hypothetical protein HDU76_008713 [Blyttiomyces sp. JEL0837]|nr:hypothetical protein HDU76_008713 [Blyttiomyces sp. JEL0837]
MPILPFISPKPEVEILPLLGYDTFLHGYWGLGEPVFVKGRVRIRSPKPSSSSLSSYPKISSANYNDTLGRLLSVRISIAGKIFTSNGDARKHSPYEASTFFDMGPEEFYASPLPDRAIDDGVQDGDVPNASQDTLPDDPQSSLARVSEHLESQRLTTTMKLRRQNQDSKRQYFDGGAEQTTLAEFERERKSRSEKESSGDDAGSYSEIYWSFMISDGTGIAEKLHPSLSASDPEWGFGARISYEISASVKFSCHYEFVDWMAALFTASTPATLTHGELIRRFNKTQQETPLLVSIANMFASPPSLIPAATQALSYLTSTIHKAQIRTIKSTKPLTLIRFTPSSLTRAIQNPKTSPLEPKRWSSRFDEPPTDLSERQSASMIQYEVEIPYTTFGPGDIVPVIFRVKPKPGSHVKMTSFRVWIEELQGVGLEIQRRGSKMNGNGNGKEIVSGQNTKSEKYLDELAEMMEATTLGRNWMAVEIAAWEGKERTCGEYWTSREIYLQIPPLAAQFPYSGIFGPKYKGINPSGRFANRVQIEHKVKARIGLQTSNGSSLPSVNLAPTTVFVNSFGKTRAEEVIESIPKLCRDILEMADFIEFHEGEKDGDSI